MPNTILTYVATGQIATTSGALAAAAMQLIPLDLTLPRFWGLLPVSDAPVFATPNLVRTVVAQMTPTITDATGTAVLGVGGNSGNVASVTITDQGGLYAAPPVVTFTGGTPVKPAQGFASCQVRGCNVLLGGSGYTAATTVTFRGPLAPGGVPATGTATVVLGAVTGIVMTNTGGPYLQQPDVIIADSGGGVGAEVVAGLSVSSVTVTYGGVGYQSVPNVVFTPLFKQMVPDSAGNPNQQATLKGWMDGFLRNGLKMAFASTTTAS